MTGFPGVVMQAPPGTPTPLPQFRLIDTKAASARILRLTHPGFVWDGRAWQAPQVLSLPAGKIGLVFGVALDDEGNAYLAASSAWGIHVVAPAPDGSGRMMRLRNGSAQARFMPGQWGEGGGPGSIWRVDARTGEVSLFADIRLNGQPNSGPALGNIAFDPVHKQFFVSDLDTGMIHRLDMAGQDLEQYDHGVTGRQAAGLTPVPFDPANRLNIRSAAFDATDPATWAYTVPERRVWGLAVHEGRLYYAVARSRAGGRAEVWSVALDPQTGAFTNDVRRELELPADASRDEISDIAFTRNGAMIVAQRAALDDPFSLKRFTRLNRARVLRYWLEDPDDPATPSRWIAEPEEYAIGMTPPHRATSGGIALGYGYDDKGVVNRKVCHGSLWSTGDNLRLLPDPARRPGVVRTLHGVQGAPARPVRPFNTPPQASYMVDFDNRPGYPEEAGWMGDVEIFAPGCAASEPGPMAHADTPLGGPFTPWDYPPTSDWTYPDDQGPLPCALTPEGCGSGGEEKPEFALNKRCDICQKGEDGKFTCSCTITVTHNGVPFDGQFVIDEKLTGGGTITNISADEGWMCTPLPTATPSCAIKSDALPADGGSTSIKVEITFDSMEEMEKARNCAAGKLEDGDTVPESCAGFAAVKVEKRMVEECAIGTPCSFQITVTNLSTTNAYNGPVTVVDNLSGATMTITSISPSMCTPEPTTAPFACVANVNLPPGGSITWTITGMLVPASYSTENVEVKNCGAASPAPADQTGEWWEDYLKDVPSDASCVSKKVCAFSCHMKDTTDLTVEKQLKSETCEPGGLCTYTITLTNTGTSDRSGPFSIREYLPAGATFVSVTPLPWTCAPDNASPAHDVVCKYPPGMPVPAGGSLSFDITIAIPANYQDSQITNCAGFDVAGSGQENPAQMLARLPNFGRLAGKKKPQEVMVAYLRSRGLSEEESRKLAAVALMPEGTNKSGGPVTGKDKSCVSTPVAFQEEQQAPRVKPPVKVPTPVKPKTNVVKQEPKSKPPRCVKPAFRTRKGTCACPKGWKQVSPTRCVRKKPPIQCVKPAFPVKGGRACACPKGWKKISPTRCAKVEPPIQCEKPAFPVRGGRACACPPGWVKVSPTRCKKVRLDCEPPAFPTRKGTCACPAGWVKVSPTRCERVLRCEEPAFPVRGGRACACPKGWVKVSPTRCKKKLECEKPAFPIRNGLACACPRGWRKVSPTRCIRWPVCEPPARPGPRGCVCPKGWVKVSPTRCKKVRLDCEPPAFPTRKGTCACPKGWKKISPTRCAKVEPPIQCEKPAFPVRGGRACACPRGWVKVSPTRCKKRLECVKPAFPTRKGTCACPKGWVKVSPTRCAKIKRDVEKPKVKRPPVEKQVLQPRKIPAERQEPTKP